MGWQSDIKSYFSDLKRQIPANQPRARIVVNEFEGMALNCNATSDKALKDSCVKFGINPALITETSMEAGAFSHSINKVPAFTNKLSFKKRKRQNFNFVIPKFKQPMQPTFDFKPIKVSGNKKAFMMTKYNAPKIKPVKLQKLKFPNLNEPIFNNSKNKKNGGFKLW